ncbi:MAG: T9SS type A sorting domain-containing protein [Prolixibacteraceae bacterium]
MILLPKILLILIDTIKIYNSDGQLMLSEQMQSNETSINIASFDQGIYFIVAKTNKGLLKQSFVKKNNFDITTNFIE